jgi:hypothetical protein
MARGRRRLQGILDFRRNYQLMVVICSPTETGSSNKNKFQVPDGPALPPNHFSFHLAQAQSSTHKRTRHGPVESTDTVSGKYSAQGFSYRSFRVASVET